MKVSLELCIVAAIVIAIGLASCWLVDHPDGFEESKRRVVVALDRSSSNRPEALCFDLRRVVEKLTQEGSQLSLVLLVSTSNGGVERLGQWQLAGNHRLLEGKEQSESIRESLVAEIVAACESLKTPTRVSPVFQLLEYGLAYFDPVFCGSPQSHCRLVVRTDGQESVDRELREQMRRQDKEQGTARLHNEHVAVEICGLAERSDRRGPSLSTVRKVLRREFSHPEHVQLTAGCQVFGGNQ